jgi:hypothetical protein
VFNLSNYFCVIVIYHIMKWKFHNMNFVSFFQQMLKERMICHASGDVSHPFIVGFYLYHIVQQEKDQKG